MGHVADPDSCDQAFSPRGYQGAELVGKPFVGHGLVHHAQVYRGKLPDAQRCQIVFDARADLIGIVIGQYRAEIVPARGDLADQRQFVGVGEKRLPDQFVNSPCAPIDRRTLVCMRLGMNSNGGSSRR